MFLGTSDKQVAQQRMQALIREIEREAAGIIPRKPIRETALRKSSEHLDDFLANRQKTGRADRHVSNIEWRVGKLIKECGWNAVTDVTADSFQAWRQRQDFAPKTLNDYLGAVSSLMNWLQKNGRLAVNSLKSVERWAALDTKGDGGGRSRTRKWGD